MKKTIKTTANYSKKTFTIRCYDNGKLYAKYRTNAMNQDEFNTEEFNTENDWQNFLKTSMDYYQVK